MKFWPILLIAAAALPAHADSIGIPFQPYYTLTSVTRPAGLPGGWGTGGILMDPANPNELLIGDFSGSSSGDIVSSAVLRDPSTSNIVGFTGSLSTVASAPFIDGGLTYGPGGYLYFTQYPADKIGEITPGGNSPGYLVPTSAPSSTGGLAFVPAGFAGAGNAAISSYNGDSICSAQVTAEGDGSYAFGPCGDTVNLGYSPEAVVYVSAGTLGFSVNSILVADFSPSDAGAVIAYQIDANGMPILATASTLLSGIAGAEGIALDPVSGDILVDSFNSNTWDVLTSNAAPEPVSMALVGGGLLLIAGFRRKGRQ